MGQSAPSSTAGIFIVRAWLERDRQLRARITRSTNVLGREEIVEAAASADAIQLSLRSWLQELLRRTDQ